MGNSGSSEGRGRGRGFQIGLFVTKVGMNVFLGFLLFIFVCIGGWVVLVVGCFVLVIWFVWLIIDFFVRMFVNSLFVRLFVCFFVCLFVCHLVCLVVCLFDRLIDFLLD